MLTYIFFSIKADKCYTFLPVIVVVILQINRIEQYIALSKLQGYAKLSGSSAATKFGVKLRHMLWCTGSTLPKRYIYIHAALNSLNSLSARTNLFSKEKCVLAKKVPKEQSDYLFNYS